MGQKVNPNGLRVAVTKNWRSRWYADKKEFGPLLHEDIKIRDMVKKRLKDAAVPEILIERYANRARVTVLTARPGIVIGRKGADIEKLREEIGRLTGKEIYMDIRE
ncbi:MAG: 30S ribosomal protein S3, partial [Kiritimatiellae bacterium]|nr:30S ribosomal protein S3 [Kiritimatiellia bacterium]